MDNPEVIAYEIAMQKRLFYFSVRSFYKFPAILTATGDISYNVNWTEFLTLLWECFFFELFW